MVQVINDPNSGSVFGRLGKGFGQGLAEEIPKHIKANTLSQSIRKLGESKDTSPLSQVADLYGIPGITPEIAQAVQPILASERAKNASQQLYGKNGSVSLKEENVPPKYDRESEDYLIPKSQEKLNQRANEIAATTGLLFPEALAQAEKEDQTRVQNENAFESRNTLADNEFEKYLETEIQKQGNSQYADVVGEMKNEYRTNVQNEVAKGLTPKQAGLQEAKKLLDFAKTRSKLTTQGLLGISGTSPQEARRSLRDIRKTYEDKDKLELFRNDLISKIGMSKEFADSVTYPIEKNKELANDIREVGLKNRLGKVDKLFGNIESHLTPSDSVNAISLALYERGVNPDKFRERLSQDYRNKKISLSESQVRELQEPIKSYAPNLKDIWYTSLLGKTHKL